MSLKSEIKEYTDKNGYVNPNPISKDSGRSCDNSTMFSSEIYIMLTKRQEDSPRDADEWEILIDKSSIKPGLTARYPEDNAPDSPDNLYAILAASKVLNKPKVAQDFLNYGLRNFGFYNPSNPDHILNKDKSINWITFQWRQPQLVFAALCAANKHEWWHFWNLGFALYTFLVILVSCINTPITDTDSRRLAWLLIQATCEDSLLCILASKLWYKRLYKDYKYGMRNVAAIYYYPQGLDANPFSKYWAE